MKRLIQAGWWSIVTVLCLLIGIPYAQADGPIPEPTPAPLLIEEETVYKPTIVGGHETSVDDWPWMAALAFANEPDGYYAQYCGGTLIAPDWVLTAAHCTRGLGPSDIDVILGRSALSSSEGERIGVAQIIAHPAYDPYTFDADLALLHLAASSNQPTITLVNQQYTAMTTSGSMSTVLGWGNMTGRGASYPDLLQEVSIPIVSNGTCNAAISYHGMVTDNMICAGYPEGGKDACQGDSGGPQMVFSPVTGWMQVGIVSWGTGCALPDKYGVYTRLSIFRSWIESQMGYPLSAPPELDNVLYFPFMN